MCFFVISGCVIGFLGVVSFIIRVTVDIFDELTTSPHPRPFRTTTKQDKPSKVEKELNDLGIVDYKKGGK